MPTVWKDGWILDRDFKTATRHFFFLIHIIQKYQTTVELYETDVRTYVLVSNSKDNLHATIHKRTKCSFS